MAEIELHRRAVALLLLLASLRSLVLHFGAEPADLLDPATGPPTALPDLASASSVELSWLPGVGGERARRIAALRPHLGVRLTPELLARLPGIGQATAAAVAEWYGRGGRSEPLASPVASERGPPEGER